MPQADDDPAPARRERARVGRRDRTKSPSNEELDNENNEEGGAPPRRRSTINFSADKLLESLKEASEKTEVRLHRAVATAEGPSSRSGGTSGRRPPARTMSAQAPRSNPRRIRSGDQDFLSQSMGDPYEMDGSNLSHLSSSDRRRRPPQRTRSVDEANVPRGATQRARPGRKKTDRDDEADEMGASSRRRIPPRTRSAEAMAARGAMRTSRQGRRRPPHGDDNDDDDEGSSEVVISDSEEEIDNSRGSGHITRDDIDRSSRRRIPQRARSTDGGIVTTRGARATRAPRRRPSGSAERSDASPKRTGPALMRSNTTTPQSAGSGPGLTRTNTQINHRTNRARGGRNTAQELAQVTASQRERSPDPFERAEPAGAKDALRHKNSVSPIKSRQERRRLREEKEREALDRRMQGVLAAANYEDEVEPPVVEKKDQPWMRRLKKAGGKTNDDSFSLEEAAARQDALHGLDNSGKAFFPVDPTFGVFAAEPVAHVEMSSFEDDMKNEDALLSTAANDKLDFSSIS